MRHGVPVGPLAGVLADPPLPVAFVQPRGVDLGSRRLRCVHLEEHAQRRRPGDHLADGQPAHRGLQECRHRLRPGGGGGRRHVVQAVRGQGALQLLAAVEVADAADDVGRCPAQETLEGVAVAGAAGQGERYVPLLAGGDRTAEHAPAVPGVQEQVRRVEECDAAGRQAQFEGLQQPFSLAGGEQLLRPQQDRPERRARADLVGRRDGARLPEGGHRPSAVEELRQVPQQARLAGTRFAQHHLDRLAGAAGQGLLLQDARQALLGAAPHVHVPQRDRWDIGGAVVRVSGRSPEAVRLWVRTTAGVYRTRLTARRSRRDDR